MVSAVTPSPQSAMKAAKVGGHGQLDVSEDRVGHQVGAAEHQEHPDPLAHGRGAGPLRLLSWAVVDIENYAGSHVRSQS